MSGIDRHLVHHEARHVVARGRIRIDQAEVLALEILDVLVARLGLHIEHRMVALGAVVVHFDGERLDLGADHIGAGVGRRTVHRDMDVAGALAFDHRGIVVGDPQRHLGAELLRQILGQRASSGWWCPRRFRPESCRTPVRDTSPSNPRRGGRSGECQRDGARDESLELEHGICASLRRLVIGRDRYLGGHPVFGGHRTARRTMPRRC